jgi:hypothetical protein
MIDDAKAKLLAETLYKIREIDEEIDNLQDTRSTLADPLEKAARVYYTVRRGNRLGLCSRCYFVFAGTHIENKQVVAVFGTDCSWCGKGGQALRVPLVMLSPYL